MGKGTQMHAEGTARPLTMAEEEGSRRPRFAVPHFGVKEKAKAFHISADVQLEQDSKREGKAGGTDFAALSRARTCSYTRWGRRGCSLPCSHYHIFLPPNPQV